MVIYLNKIYSKIYKKNLVSSKIIKSWLEIIIKEMWI